MDTILFSSKFQTYVKAIGISNQQQINYFLHKRAKFHTSSLFTLSISHDVKPSSNEYVNQHILIVQFYPPCRKCSGGSGNLLTMFPMKNLQAKSWDLRNVPYLGRPTSYGVNSIHSRYRNIIWDGLQQQIQEYNMRWFTAAENILNFSLLQI